MSLQGDGAKLGAHIAAHGIFGGVKLRTALLIAALLRDSLHRRCSLRCPSVDTAAMGNVGAPVMTYARSTHCSWPSAAFVLTRAGKP